MSKPTDIPDFIDIDIGDFDDVIDFDGPLDPPDEPPRGGGGFNPPDPEPTPGAGFTAVVCLVPVLFGSLYFATFYAPAFWGPLGALALSVPFGILYLGGFWWGARWIESYRY